MDVAPVVWSSRWFSMEIEKCSWPWIFDNGDTPSLVISALEALAVLVALKLFRWEESSAPESKIMVVRTWTGNDAALSNLMTTKFPALAILMEIAAHVKRDAYAGCC